MHLGYFQTHISGRGFYGVRALMSSLYIHKNAVDAHTIAILCIVRKDMIRSHAMHRSRGAISGKVDAPSEHGKPCHV